MVSHYCLYVCLSLCVTLVQAASTATSNSTSESILALTTTTTTTTTSPTTLETTTFTVTTNATPTSSPLESNSTTTTLTTTIRSNSITIINSPSNETITQSKQQQQHEQETTRSPRSDRQYVLEMFHKFFTKARSHDDKRQKEFVRDGVINRLNELGFERSFLQKSRFEFRHEPAYSFNMISILPGKHRFTKDDRIILIGAHWDSATKAPGVDDNGSGSTCLLEIARLIAENKCSFNHTVMLVWFDYEEQGKFGSEFFVNDYLFPMELEKYKSQFIGAYILDMTLVRDKEINTQTIPMNLKVKLKDFSDEIENEKFRGDFLATWARKTWDEPLEEAFRSAWVNLGYESRTFKAMRPELPQIRLPNGNERYEWKDFFRSDHASFWFPPLTSTPVRRSPNRTSTAGHFSLNAILLTDLGPWRKSYSKCYHSACDDEHFLTDDNLGFMQQVIDTLVLTLLRVGEGECKQSQSSLCGGASGDNNGGLIAAADNQTARGCTSSSQAH